MGVFRHQIEELEDSPIVEVFRSGFGTEGLIAMWAGEPDVPTPQFICDAAAEALRAGRTFYSYNRGLPALRAAIAGYLRRLHGAEIGDDRIAFTLSGMNAVMQVAQATVNPGDNVVAITPSWPNIMRAMQINGASVREVMLARGNAGWRLDLDAVFAACDAQTRVIYLATPGNPTGWMIEPAEAAALLGFCRARNIALLSDEVYHRIVYDRPVAFSFLEIARPDDPLFVVNSFSKSWAMTGWRMGWVIYPAGGTGAFEKLIQFNTSGGLEFLQAGGIAAIEQGEDFVRFFVERCRTARGIANARLAAMPRVQNIPNNGAFYAMFGVEGMTDSMQFCLRAVRRRAWAWRRAPASAAARNISSASATPRARRPSPRRWTAWNASSRVTPSGRARDRRRRMRRRRESPARACPRAYSRSHSPVCSSKIACSMARKSPCETMPSSVPSTVTGRWRNPPSCMVCSASKAVRPGATVVGLRVITSSSRIWAGLRPSASRRTASRPVKMPSSIPSASVISTAPILCSPIRAQAAFTVS